MSTKMYYDNLYVAFPVYDHEVETEQYVQYETFGTIEHTIIVGTKKKLICSQIGEDGIERFYDYKTGEEVHETLYTSSFETSSSAWHSVYCTYINGIRPLAIPALREQMLERFYAKQKCLGYFIPFTQYIQKTLGIDVSSLSADMADKLLRLMNIAGGKAIVLSTDPDTAREQLEKIGYHSETKKK